MINAKFSNLEVGWGLGKGKDGFRVGMDAARKAMDSIQRHPLSAVLVFSSVCYELEALLAGVCEVVGDAPVLGATTAGEILDGPHQQSVVIVTLASPFLSVRVGIGRDVSRDWNKAVAQAVGAPEIRPYFLPHTSDIWHQLELDGKSAFGILFSPGNTKHADSKSFEVLEELKELSGGLLPIIGGSCADDWHMEQNYVLFGARAYPDSVLVAVFETQLKIGMGLSHGFKPTSNTAVVTKSEGHEVLQLDNRPAAEVYSELTGYSEEELKGKHLTLTTGKPVGSPIGYGQYSIKVASYFTKQRGIRFSQPMMEGIPLVIMEPDNGSMITAGRDAVRTALLRGRIKDPSLVLTFSCALRYRTLADQCPEEIFKMKELLGDVPVAGLYCFGEQGLGDDWINRHQNNVISVLVFGQELSRTARASIEHERLLKELKFNIEQKERAEKRISYLNSLLLAIRNINQIIVREKDPIRMIKGACENLVNTRGFQSTWIALFGESGHFVAGEQGGLAKDFSYIVEQLKRGTMTYCTQVALNRAGVNYINDPSSVCPACILARKALCREAISIRLEHDGKVFGVMTVLRSETYPQDEREQELIKEVAGDIAFALKGMELEKEKRRVEEVLKKSEERYRTLVEESFDGIFIQKGTKIIFANRRLHEMLGYGQGELIGVEHWRVYHPEYQEITRQRARDRMAGKRVITHYEVKLQRKDGSWFYGEIGTKVIEVEGEPGIQVWIKDIDERKRAEEALKSQEEKFRTLVEKSPFGIAVIAKDGRYKYINPKFVEMFGYDSEDLETGREWFRKAFPEKEHRKRVIETWLSDLKSRKPGESTPRTFRVTCKDGSEKLVFFKSVALADGEQFVIYDDMTEKERMEKQLRQAQRLEAMGTLAGGIAHDFNNILAAIVGYTELAMMEVPKKSRVRHNLEQVILASKRAKELVRQILTFSRQGEQEKRPVNVVSIFKEALRLLRASIPSTIEIREDIERDSSVSTILADPTQMHQVFMNLCTNAAHAMREKGGVLGIEIKNVRLSYNDIRSAHSRLSPGTYLRLSVSDTGHGMTPEVMERIFDPYFTTKDKSEGTGLGLAMVHGIVRDHGGAINVYSEPGKGSIFRVYLPVIDKEEERVQEPIAHLLKGNERILFVDDEPTLIEVGVHMLEFLGYKVTARTSSVEALELFKTKPEEFDLVITDMTMPHMTGDILAQKLMEIRPSIPVIICTGFSERISAEKARQMGIQGFAMKPLVMEDLARIIREVLELQLTVSEP